MPENKNFNSNEFQGKENVNEKDSNLRASNSDSGSRGNNQKNKNQTRKGKSCGKGRNNSRNGQGNGKVASFNHPDWYMPNEAIGEQIASIPFNIVAGAPIKLIASSPYNYKGGAGSMPGNATTRAQSIMTIDYFSTPGVSENGVSGINMAAAKIYAAIRSKNSGAKVYEAPDVMMYILLMQDIYANLCSIFRAIGVSSYFTIMDRNVPDVFTDAFDINMADVRANRYSYLSKVNALIEKVNSFAVPANLKIFQRSAYINTNIFRDSDSIYGQYYAFKKLNYYLWSAKTSTHGTELTCHLFDNQGGTLQNIIDIVENQLDDLFLDSDVLTISADILKAFENVNLYKFKPLSGDFAVQPSYDEYILSQIHNMNWLHVDEIELMNANKSFDITQKDQIIIYKPEFSPFNVGAGADEYPFAVQTRPFDSHSDDPNYKDVLEGTRLMVSIISTDTSSQAKYKISSCGSELPINVVVHYRSAGASFNRVRIPMITIETTGPNSTEFHSSQTSDYRHIVLASQYRMSPLRYQVVATVPSAAANNNQWQGFDILGDIHHLANIDYKLITDINNIVMYAMYILE